MYKIEPYNELLCFIMFVQWTYVFISLWFSFDVKINRAKERETRGFSVGNLIMNLEGQKQKLTLEFTSYIERLAKFLEQNKNFSDRCLNRIKLISSEITTSEEQEKAEGGGGDEDGGGD